MRDREIVAAIVAGDPAGLAAAYDRYAAVLHVYCRSLLAEPADAADVVQDTFVIAAAKLADLRDPTAAAVALRRRQERVLPPASWPGQVRLAGGGGRGDRPGRRTEPPDADHAALRELVSRRRGRA